MHDVIHRTLEELAAGLDEIRRSPKNEGLLELIVRRPRVGEREILDIGELDVAEGLRGDRWLTGGRSPDPETQLNLMNSRVIALVAQTKERWSLAGDQLFVDLDLSGENLPPGTQLAIGSAVIEVTAEPHTGCRKFRRRFGLDAMKFVNSAPLRELHLRGICAKVVRSGTIREDDVVRKV